MIPNSFQPPAWAIALLRQLVPVRDHHAVLGDLDEAYRERRQSSGQWRADLWYGGQVLRNLPAALLLRLSPPWAIWRMDWVASLRRMGRQKRFAFINVVGLGIGLAVALFIVAWIYDEIGYDRHFPNTRRICRVIGVNGASRVPTGPGPLAGFLKHEIPEIVEATRFHGTSGLYLYNDKSLRLEGLRVEPSFFKVFGWPLLQGEEEGAIDAIGDMVLTESTARRFFGEEDPIGKVLRVERLWTGTVNAVVADVPRQTSPPLKFEFLEAFALYYRMRHPGPDNWEGASDYHIYVLLDEKATAEAVNQKIETLLRRYQVDENVHYELEPLTDIHLFAHCTRWDGPHGDYRLVRLFAAIGGLVLLLAVINYMNLATARALTRNREIGLRKILGARRRLLVRQALVESVVTAWGAGGLALFLFVLGLPLFARWTGVPLAVSSLPPWTWIGLGVAVTALGVMAGIYPAALLSKGTWLGAFRAGTVSSDTRQVSRVRQGMVVFQFVLTIGILTAGMAVYRQIHYVLNYPLGFKAENVLIVPTGGEYPFDAYAAFKQSLVGQPGISAVGTSYQLPDGIPELSGISWSQDGQRQYAVYPTYRVNEDYLDVFGMRLAQGRFFRENPPASETGYVINQAAARRMGMTDPVGQVIAIGDEAGPVLGVLEDFHFQSLLHPIQPLFLLYARQGDHVDIRLDAMQRGRLLPLIEQAFRRHYPELPYAPHWLDEQLNRRYVAEQQLERILAVFALVALGLSCLGLFGLASYTLERRKKEVSIRKVLGAATGQVMGLFLWEFAQGVLWASALAWLLAGTYVDQWLRQFAIRSPFPWWTLPLAGGVVLAVALLTVFGQVVTISARNPAEVLRHE